VEIAMKFRIAIYPSDEGLAVCAPGLPGCWSRGASRDEAMANIAVAIREYLEADLDPVDGAEAGEVEVSV
jgi:predicted RNase H-like HicB family nuclease